VGGNSRTDDARSAAASAASAAARPMVCVAPTTSARAAHGPREGASGEGGRRGGRRKMRCFVTGRGIPSPLPPSSPTLVSHPRALLLPSPAAPSPLHVQSADGRAVVVSLQSAVCVFADRSDQVGPGRGWKERESAPHTHTHRRGRQGEPIQASPVRVRSRESREGAGAIEPLGSMLCCSGDTMTGATMVPRGGPLVRRADGRVDGSPHLPTPTRTHSQLSPQSPALTPLLIPLCIRAQSGGRDEEGGGEAQRPPQSLPCPLGRPGSGR
jgi:hypothetical protein